MVGYGDPVGIAAQVAKGMFRAAEGTFRVDHPIIAKELAEPGGEGLGLSKGYQVSVKAELALSECFPERRHELAAKNPAEHFDWQKEGIAGFDLSEALHLLVSDITPDGLLVRRTKFQKTRLVPLHETAVTGLAHYLMHRQEARRGGDHVFASDEGKPLVYWKLHKIFRTLLKSAGIEPSNGRWPRIPELRHTFAVRALEASPTGRQRIGQHMLALATYLGHVNINATYWYLETTPELLLEIAVVAEDFVQGGRQ